MTQEDLNSVIEKSMPQWRKDQIHNEEDEQRIYDSGYKAGYEEAMKQANKTTIGE